jgi:hypothetical protein
MKKGIPKNGGMSRPHHFLTMAHMLWSSRQRPREKCKSWGGRSTMWMRSFWGR